MENTEKRCTSCGRRVTNDRGAVMFKCPACGNEEIIRCRHCRETAAKYTCTQCNFEGPN
ncbi:DUF1610 domain-containing protein [Candidatus Woesearchaeota archaeon]|nr:DUF1610 domain-containing protein [Candidatus Woesearchaeota archaeon]